MPRRMLAGVRILAIRRVQVIIRDMEKPKEKH
jgi:hypothetical protein